MIKEKIGKLIDVKSIATLTLLITLEIITILVFVKSNMELIQLVFLMEKIFLTYMMLMVVMNKYCHL